MTLNELYGAKGPITPDYFDCKMLNDLAEELSAKRTESLIEARKLYRLIGLCRDVTARYHWQTKLNLTLKTAIETHREWARVRSMAENTARAYIRALDRDASKFGRKTV